MTEAGTIGEQARQEAIRRNYGSRMADWFERGAYAASKGAAVPPARRPTRAWFLNGVRWFEAQQALPI